MPPVQALGQFRRALQLDPTFVPAQLYLASAEWRASWNVPKADSLLENVQLRRDELLPDDRASLDWLRAFVRGDRQGILEAAREMATLKGTARQGSAVQPH